MSHAVLDDLDLMILIGDESYAVSLAQDMDSGVILAEVSLPQSTSYTLTQLLGGEPVQGNYVALRSQDFVKADAELRSLLLRHNLNITTTQYWFTVGDPAISEYLYLEDCDPDTHTTILIGNHTRSFSPHHPNSAAFVDELQQSELCEGCRWNSSSIEVALTPSSVTDENRLATFIALVSLYRPEN